MTLESDGTTSQCPICSKLLSSVQKLQLHVRSHKGDKRYLCNYCGRRFLTKYLLNGHSCSYDCGKVFNCKDCRKTFHSALRLKAHSEIHRTDNKFQCKDCKKCFANATRLRLHLETHREDRPFQCEICHKTFKTPSNLRWHAQSHNDSDKEYRCSVCGASFRWKSRLHNHLLARHNQSTELNIATSLAPTDHQEEKPELQESTLTTAVSANKLAKINCTEMHRNCSTTEDVAANGEPVMISFVNQCSLLLGSPVPLTDPFSIDNVDQLLHVQADDDSQNPSARDSTLPSSFLAQVSNSLNNEYSPNSTTTPSCPASSIDPPTFDDFHSSTASCPVSFPRHAELDKRELPIEKLMTFSIEVVSDGASDREPLFLVQAVSPVKDASIVSASADTDGAAKEFPTQIPVMLAGQMESLTDLGSSVDDEDFTFSQDVDGLLPNSSLPDAWNSPCIDTLYTYEVADQQVGSDIMTYNCSETIPEVTSSTSPVLREKDAACSSSSPGLLESSGSFTLPSKKVRKRRSFTCKECGQTFMRNSWLVQHRMSSHQVEPQISCVWCSAKFIDRAGLNGHIAHAHRNARMHDCPVCGKVFSRPVAMRRHAKIHAPPTMFHCRQCSSQQTFDTRRELDNHQSTAHQPNHFCPQCGKTLSSKRNLLAHLQLHAGQKDFLCEACGHVFRTANALTLHSCPFTDRTPHECPQCNKKFYSHSSLKSHQQVHLPVRRHVCPRCSKSFCNTTRLRLHLQTHENIRRFACSACDKTFKTASNLRCHFMAHSDRSKFFKCKFCQASFCWRSKLLKHEEKHHKR